ncbi:hypothetical protein D3C78_1271040 [compost metagenome]
MKFTRLSGWIMLAPKSAQLVYSVRPMALRNSFSVGMPRSRPRAMLIAARSSGMPSRPWLSAGVTNSSISLACWWVMPRAMAAAPFCANSSGDRKARSSATRITAPVMSPAGSIRSIDSRNVLWPKR